MATETAPAIGPTSGTARTATVRLFRLDEDFAPSADAALLWGG